MVGLEFLHLLDSFNIILNPVGKFENVGFAGKAIAKVVEHRLPSAAIQLSFEDDEHSELFAERFNVIADLLFGGGFALFILDFFSHLDKLDLVKHPYATEPGSDRND